MNKQKDIVERTPGYTDEMMIDDCECMLKVLSKTKEIFIGRGKNRQSMQVPMYRDNQKTVDRIKKSIKYYQQCSLENTNKK